MQNHNEYGRTMSEMLAILAIVSILTLGAIAGFRQAITNQKINDIIHAVNLGSVQALSALNTTKINSPDEMDNFLKQYATTAGGYNIDFKAPRDVTFTGMEFVAQITTKDGQRIKGRMCRKLLTTMVKVNGVSDIDFSVKQEEDGKTQEINMRLSGKAVDLNALCGSDIL